MLLRIVKEISPEAAKRIAVAAAKIKLLEELRDGTFLCKDLEGYEAETLKRGGPKKAIVENLGFFTHPEYELGKGYAYLCYKKAMGEKTLRGLNFTCGPARTYGVSFEIIDRAKNEMEFLLGPFIALKSYEYNFSPSGNIYELARFFHNRKALYQKIYKTLSEKKAENSAFLTAPFIEDLLLLFSVATEEEKPEDFAIPEKNIRKQLLERKVLKKNMLPLGRSYFYPKAYPDLEYPLFPTTNIELFLNNKNQLIINETVDIGWKQSALKIEDIMNQEEFIAYTNHTLKDWLQQLLSMAAFGEKIYEKVKTKIFLETL
jgi:hypothetical protein